MRHRTVKRRLRWLVVLPATLLALAGPSATAAENEPVTLKISQNARLIEGGAAIVVVVDVRCDPVGDVLEAFVTVQDQFGFLDVICDGDRHRNTVRVEAIDFRFEPGDAQASAFVLICDAEENCVSGQDTRRVKIRG